MNAVRAQAKVFHVPELYSVEAEQGLIGAILSVNAQFWKVSESIGAADFFDPLHSRIWGVTETLMDRGLLASPATVAAEMAADKGLAEVGPEYLRNLAYGAPISAPVKQYTDVIVGFARRRRIVGACSDAIDRAYFDQAAKPDEIADGAAETIYEAAHCDEPGRGVESLSDVAARAAQMAEDARLHPETAKIPTGLRCVDHALGGLFPRDLTILAAPPNLGKSGLVGQITVHAARTDYTTLFFSHEMTSVSVAMRMLAQDADVPANRLTEGRATQEEVERSAEAARTYTDLPLYIDGTPKLAVAQIRARAHALKRRKGALHLIAIDHLRRIKPANPRADFTEQMDQITQDLHAVAEELDVAILLIATLNREFWKRPGNKPLPSDLYGASAIEYNADHIWFLHREEFFLERAEPSESDQKAHGEWAEKMERARGMAELFSAKRRGGPVGSARLKFDAPFVRFTDPDDFGPVVSPQERMF